MPTGYRCEYAWLPPGEVHGGVTIELHDGRIVGVHQDPWASFPTSGEPTSGESAPDADRPPPPADGRTLPGLTLPGLANAHSHAFHRALRGRTHDKGGTFWAWRKRMYRLAERLEPDTLFELAVATYGEMVAAGVTCVGEFHYLHHPPGGGRYADPNAMGHALVAAARRAGLAITLLDTCYLTGGIGRSLEGVQRRFSDGDADRWAERVGALHAAYSGDPDVIVGAAIHSVRAVPADQMSVVADWTGRHHAPLHVHLSEQPAENEECLAAYGMSPTRLLDRHGVLGPRTTAVHATHLTDADVALLGGSGTTVAVCPTTERDLADGLGRIRDLAEAGCPIALGSDSHAVIDMFEEARGVEFGERLRTGIRGHWSPDRLLAMATENGHAALGRAGAGVLAPGAPAELVTIRWDGPRTASIDLEPAGPRPPDAGTLMFAVTAADVVGVTRS